MKTRTGIAIIGLVLAAAGNQKTLPPGMTKAPPKQQDPPVYVDFPFNPPLPANGNELAQYIMDHCRVGQHKRIVCEKFHGIE